MIKFMKNHYLKFIMFCFVGGTSALIDWGFFNLFYYFSVSFILSRVFGTLVAIIYNFSMNRNVTFSVRDGKLKKQLIRYLVLYSFSIGINWFASVLILNLLGETLLNANIATLCGIVIAIPFSFLGSLLWVFKK